MYLHLVIVGQLEHHEWIMIEMDYNTMNFLKESTFYFYFFVLFYILCLRSTGCWASMLTVSALHSSKQYLILLWVMLFAKVRREVVEGIKTDDISGLMGAVY